MAWSALEERQNHMLKGHGPIVPPYGRRRTFRRRIGLLNSQVTDYLGMPAVGHDEVVQSGPPAGGQPSAHGSGRVPGAAIELANVVGQPSVVQRGVVQRGVAQRGVAQTSATGAEGTAAAPGVSLRVPPGQSVALLSQPPGAAADLFDAIAGLGRPRAGQVRVDGVAVNELGRVELDRYRARRGLASERFPLLGSLSVIDNVLAAPPVARAGAPAPEQAMRMLELAGAGRLSGPVHRLSAEEQWRIIIARALVSLPRLVLAEDPAPGLDSAAADRVLDVLMDAHAMFGFTLVLTANRPATAVRCQRRVLVAGGTVAEDEIDGGDDAWTRSRIDRIG
jgi:predicted ABC-type transport system involved in lysophospholipase L1 biosynthesis ATPase subunit